MNDPAALISRIYDAALDSSRWPSFMEGLAASLNAGIGMLWLHDFEAATYSFDSDGGNLSTVTGLDATTLAEFSAHYGACNVWVPNASQLAEGSITISSALYPDALLKRTEWYDGFLRKCDLFYAVGSSIVKEPRRDVKMSFVRSERAGSYDEAELHLVRQLLPHLRNAVLLHRNLYRLQTLAASAVAALDRVPMGIVLLTSSGLLMHANRRAHELVNTTAALRFEPSGSLQASTPAATGHLQRLIRDAVGTAAGKSLSPGGALRLIGRNGRRLHLIVTPLPLERSPFADDAAAAIFCSDPDAGGGAVARQLEGLFGMTPAEARLTEALVNGQSLGEYAQARRVTMSTVRTQLKAATAKTGTRRQADLVRIVLTGPAVLGQGKA
ncbi:MAG: helix-turn-helix transcriptional regulator [Caldimonas sp.]